MISLPFGRWPLLAPSAYDRRWFSRLDLCGAQAVIIIFNPEASRCAVAISVHPQSKDVVTFGWVGLRTFLLCLARKLARATPCVSVLSCGVTLDLGIALSQDMTVETRCCEDNGACAEVQVHGTAHVEAHCCNDG